MQRLGFAEVTRDIRVTLTVPIWQDRTQGQKKPARRTDKKHGDSRSFRVSIWVCHIRDQVCRGYRRKVIRCSRLHKGSGEVWKNGQPVELFAVQKRGTGIGECQ